MNSGNTGNSDNAGSNKSTNRRHFLKRVAKGTALGVSGSLTARAAYAGKAAGRGRKMKTIRDYVSQVTLKRDVIDYFLDPEKPRWANYDPVLGYTLRNSISKDGVDGAYTIGRYGKKHGERLMINYADRPCRINTYGDSFTMCHQVSDGETWQEYLAAHLGEPMRNFGVGGYGAYHAYRCMLRKEKSEINAPFVILNIWGPDDHYRSLDAWRYLRCFGWFQRNDLKYFFHANPWDHLGFDLTTGKIVEKKNLCPTPESLYQLCDPEYIYETFKDDPALNMYLAGRPDVQANTDLLKQLAEAIGLNLDFSSTEKRQSSSRTLYWQCARRSTMWVLDKTQQFLKANNKKFLLLLSHSGGDVINACKGEPRTDQQFVDDLKQAKIRYVDALVLHAKDYQQFRLSPVEYARRYYIGHYKPLGNYFFAFGIKDMVVDWLVPNPPAYQKEGKTIRFEEYITEGG